MAALVKVIVNVDAEIAAKNVIVKNKMKSKKIKISNRSTLAKILEIKGAEKILSKNGVPCVTCPFAAMEINQLQIGKVCQMYNLDLNKILKDFENLN